MVTEEEAEQRNNAAVPASQHAEDLSGILERPLMAFVQEFRFRPPPVYCEVSHQLLETTSTYTQGSLSLIGIYKGLERSIFLCAGRMHHKAEGFAQRNAYLAFILCFFISIFCHQVDPNPQPLNMRPRCMTC